MALKIALLGAGSVVFAKTLLSDVLQFPELSDATVSLMDIDPARLKVARIMAERIIAKLGVKATVQATLDQREAIRDANYVIVTVQVGGYEPGTTIDFEIPKRYGLQQTIGDTLGIGGVFRALRTIPVINSFARDIAEVGAPNCLLLNYTNPMAMNCWAVDRAVGIPHVGLCHSVQGTSQQLASLAQLPPEDVSYLVAGINHMAFFLKFEYRRQDAYPILFSLLDKEGFSAEKVRFEMMRRTGYFVTESSEHQSEYVPYFIHHGEETIRRFDVPIDEYLRRCVSIMGTWKDTEAKLLGEGGDIEVRPQSHEYGSYIIHSRETGVPRVVYGNVPNRGLIDNLPPGCCVEVPCLVNTAGLQPTHVGALPPQLAALCQTNINVQALTVEAALTNKREHIYHAAMLDPHTAATLPLDKIWSLCDDLIAAHQAVGLLGEFQPTVRGTGRSYAGTGDRVLARLEPVPGEVADERAETLHLQVSATNPTQGDLRIPFAVRVPEGQAEVADGGELVLAVPAGGTARAAVTVRRLVGTNGTNGAQGSHGTADTPDAPDKADDKKRTNPAVLDIKLETPMRGVFARGLTLRPRPIWNAAPGHPATFGLTLAGFPAANGTLALEGDRLVATFEVEDSKITPGPEGSPWAGSSVELFVDAEGGDGPRQVFLVPQPAGSSEVRTLLHGRPLAGAEASHAPAGAGYRLRASLPLAALGLAAGARSFLFDVYVNLTALGDAHSGGRATLHGSHESHATSGHYGRLLVAA